MVSSGASAITINATITGQRFFFEVTLERPEVMKKMSPLRVEQKLPVILSAEEVGRVMEAAPGLKYQAAFALGYGAGLRAGEIVSLKVADIDGERKVMRIEQSKGRKDRYTILSPTMHKLLRAWYRHAHAQGKLLPHGWLFPGQSPINPLSTRQLNRAFHAALHSAEIDKQVSLHSLRHAYATHLLEPVSFSAMKAPVPAPISDRARIIAKPFAFRATRARLISGVQTAPTNAR